MAKNKTPDARREGGDVRVCTNGGDQMGKTNESFHDIINCSSNLVSCCVRWPPVHCILSLLVWRVCLPGRAELRGEPTRRAT